MPGGRPKKETFDKEPVFDVKRFLKAHFEEPGDRPMDLAGRVSLFMHEHCERKANGETVRKWIERNAIGGEWLAVLLDALGRLEGQPSPVTPFIGVRTTYPKREADIFG